MPYFTYRYGGTSAGTDWEECTPVTAPQIQQQFEEWQRECARQDRIMEQQMRETEEQCYQEMKRAEEEAEDRKKYPLFFWRKTCKPVRK